MLILSNGYYGGIYYHGILLDAFRKHDAKRARVMMKSICSTACTIWNPIIWGRRKTTSEPLFPV